MEIPKVEAELRERFKRAPDDNAIDDELRRLRDLGGKELAQRIRELLPKSALRSDELWPAVKFTNGTTLLCVKEEFEVVTASGRVEARRSQVSYDHI